jgi:tRNA threonylcarbamoyladenosine biosynthesis protein TsaB
MRLLAITTATPRFEAALYDGDALVAGCSYDDEMRHAEHSFVAIDRMFEEASLTPAWIEAVAVDIGPGSFTGVRVGLAGAMGIALARQAPLVGVCSLAAMAAAALAVTDHEQIASVIDAKRGEIFHAVYDREGHEHVAPAFSKCGAGLPAEMMYCGRAAAGEVDAARYVDHEESALPHAKWIAALARHRMARGDLVDIAAIEPIYARAPDAKKPSAAPKLSRA